MAWGSTAEISGHWGSQVEVAGESFMEELNEHYPANAAESSSKDQTTDHTIAKRETKAVSWLRIMVFLVLIGTAAAVAWVGFLYLSRSETANFDTSFYDCAARVIEAFRINSERHIQTIETFATTIMSHALYYNSTWPFVTLPDFEMQGEAIADLAFVMSLFFVPIVTAETRQGWEQYSVANQWWLAQSLEEQAEMMTTSVSRRELQYNNLTIPEYIHRVDGLTQTVETGPPPYLPLWEFTPVVPVPELVNFNLLSDPAYVESLKALMTAKVDVVGMSFDFLNPNDNLAIGRKGVFDLFLPHWDHENRTYANDPIADVHVPIFDTFDENNHTLVGLLTSVVYWSGYLEDVLPDNAFVQVVLENTCGQAFTYQINGEAVVYLGDGDLHASKYDGMVVSTEYGTFLEGNIIARNISGSCLYRIRIYPAQALEDVYVTNKPAIYTVTIVLVFLFTSVVFIVYDWLVQRRQRIVMDTAVASSAIVSSLFPKTVRDRLYDANTATTRAKNQEKEAGKETRRSSAAIQNYLVNADPKLDAAPEATPSKPIADLFENCTVLFADIVGFTSWSSERDPRDIFYLLETIYGAFDKLASKRRVFKVGRFSVCLFLCLFDRSPKEAIVFFSFVRYVSHLYYGTFPIIQVETIGDCYLAVTGLPEPQEGKIK